MIYEVILMSPLLPTKTSEPSIDSPVYGVRQAS